jgi:MHS family metabolite:H+ symporter-like MFS transporter
VPFLASVVVMIFAIWLRMNLKESPVFEKVNDAQTAAGHLAGFHGEKQILLAGDRPAFWSGGQLRSDPDVPGGYLVQTLLFDKAIPTDALMISSILGFISIPLLGWLSDKVGAVCRTLSSISPPLFWRIRCCRSSSIRAMRRGRSCSHHRYP